ncbi:MAG: type II secretion system GspH family protein [Fretibacterium sp.]|nr:type II secretion system GspH family protein [Fretibacterium sp.]
MKGYRAQRAHRAFTLTELLVVVAVLAILGTMGSLGMSALTRQTAKQEAERAMHWLYSVLLRADRTGRKFSLRVEGETDLVVEWRGAPERLAASVGCSFKRRGRVVGEAGTFVTYSPVWGTFTPALTVQVGGPGGDVFFLILSGQGKVCISDSPPQD